MTTDSPLAPRLLFALLLCLLAPAQAPAQPSEPQPQGELVIPSEARSGPAFDVERATRAYLQTVPAAARARSDAYFEGGYWLLLWSFVYGLAIAALWLFGRWSAWLRDRAERVARRRWLNGAIYGAGFIIATSVLWLPLRIYRDWFREHQYGLSNLGFGAWLGEYAKGTLIAVVLGSLLLVLIHTAVRRRGGNWWLPASLVTVLFLFFVTFIAPVFLFPVFNQYRPLGPGQVRDAVLSLAHANGVDAQEVYWFDASRQTSRISANVSGMLGTMRISLNDNLLGKTTGPEIKAVMAHELGHFVLNHGAKRILQVGLLLTIGFAIAQWMQRRLLARYGARWGIRGMEDIAGVPLIIALLSAWFFVTMPLTNTLVRTAEAEADLYGLNAAREPHAFASVAMRLASYRKLDPSPFEEAILFDHPSGASRVRMSMRWFAENQDAGAGAR